MGLEIHTLRDQPQAGKFYEFKERTYLDSEGNVVSAEDPDRAVLIGRPGARITWKQAQDLGLVEEDVEYYEDMTVDRLKKELSDRGLPTDGRKQDLIDRLVEDDEEQEKSRTPGANKMRKPEEDK